MKRAKQFLTLIFLSVLVTPPIFAKSRDCCITPVEVTEAKEIGLSDSDETKSVIEIQWRVDPRFQSNHSNFNVTLEIRYADGAVLIIDEQAENSSSWSQIEVPTVHLVRGKLTASIKQIKAFVTTEILDK